MDSNRIGTAIVYRVYTNTLHRGWIRWCRGKRCANGNLSSNVRVTLRRIGDWKHGSIGCYDSITETRVQPNTIELIPIHVSWCTTWIVNTSFIFAIHMRQWFRGKGLSSKEVSKNEAPTDTLKVYSQISKNATWRHVPTLSPTPDPHPCFRHHSYWNEL
jgi:hypothetical protein